MESTESSTDISDETAPPFSLAAEPSVSVQTQDSTGSNTDPLPLLQIMPTSLISADLQQPSGTQFAKGTDPEPHAADPSVGTAAVSSEVVKQLRSLNTNIVQVINGQGTPSSQPTTDGASLPTLTDQSETSASSAPCSHPQSTVPIEDGEASTTSISLQGQGAAESGEESSLHKLWEQAMSNLLPVGDTTQVSDPAAVSASSAPMSVEELSSASAHQSNVEAVVEMLLETAKNLSGLINPGDVFKTPVISTTVTTELAKTSVEESSDLETVVSTRQRGNEPALQQDPSNERPLTVNASPPGPSGLQKDSDPDPASDGTEAHGSHANREVQSLLDALLSSAESHSSGDKVDAKDGESSGTKIHKCPECDKYFPRLSSLKRHLLLHMDARPFQCDQCEANYKSASQLNRHKRYHTGAKPAKCEFCGKDFRTYNELYVHRRSHTGEKPYECQYCGKCFSTRSYRNTHQRIHTGEKRFECDFCGMKFTESSARRVHRFTHTGETPYECKVCGRGFTQAGNLNKHVKTIHSKGKPFKCDKCDKSFTIKQELRRHFQRVHSTDRPHKCSICGKSYAILSDLTHHVQLHVFRCRKCGEKFKDSKELERHIIEVCVLPSEEDKEDEEARKEEEEEEDNEETPVINVSKRGRKKESAGKGAKRRPRGTRNEGGGVKKRRIVDSPPQEVDSVEGNEEGM